MIEVCQKDVTKTGDGSGKLMVGLGLGIPCQMVVLEWQAETLPKRQI